MPSLCSVPTRLTPSSNSNPSPPRVKGWPGRRMLSWNTTFIANYSLFRNRQLATTRVRMRNFPNRTKSGRCTPPMDAVRFARPPPARQCVVACAAETLRTPDKPLGRRILNDRARPISGQQWKHWRNERRNRSLNHVRTQYRNRPS